MEGVYRDQLSYATRESLIEKVTGILKEAGFIVSKRSKAKSFDLAARKGELVLLMKVLQNIDSFSEEVAESLKRLVPCLLASPIIVGEKKGGIFLENKVIYYRYGIPAINISTFYNYFVKKICSCVYSAPGGLYVKINGEVAGEVREKKNLSLGNVAFELGVSRRSIQKYEEGEMSAAIDIALKMEEILETILIKPLDILKKEFDDIPPSEEVDISLSEKHPSFERDVLRRIKMIGFDVFTTIYTPFSAVSQLQAEKIKILTGIDRYTERMIRRAKIVSSLSEVTKTKSVFVVNGNIKRTQVDKTVLIKKEELLRIKEPEKFTSMMEERARSNV